MDFGGIMAKYENINSPKASLAETMFPALLATFGGTHAEYAISFGGVNPNYLAIETARATEEQLADFVASFQKPIDPALIQEQLRRFKRSFITERRVTSILERKVKTVWL
jgi:flagellar motor component MotA